MCVFVVGMRVANIIFMMRSSLGMALSGGPAAGSSVMRTTTSSMLTAIGSVFRWRHGTRMESVAALMLWMAIVAGSPMRRCMTCSSSPGGHSA